MGKHHCGVAADALGLVSSPYWGFQCPKAAGDLATLEALAAGHVSAAGMYMSAWLAGKYVPFPKASMDAIWSYGAQPMLTWQLRDAALDPAASPNWSCDAVLSGMHDAYITQFAKDCAAWGKPMWLRVFHESDSNWYPWGYGGGINGNTPAKHGLAFARVSRIVKTYAPNAAMVWCPDSGVTVDIKASLPDLATVDWLSVDSYNFGSFGPHGWRTASSMLDASMAWFKQLTPAKPVIISEIGCAEDPTLGDKGAWITDMAAAVAGYGNVKALLWMHDDPNGRDNRLSSSPGAAAAWQASVTASWAPGAVRATVRDKAGQAAYSNYRPLLV